MDAIIKVDLEILSGTPCFAGTRVPIKSLFDHLERGYTVDFFLNEFPTVAREQAVGLLEQVRVNTEAEARRAS